MEVIWGRVLAPKWRPGAWFQVDLGGKMDRTNLREKKVYRRTVRCSTCRDEERGTRGAAFGVTEVKDMSFSW